jgi:HSP20 family protein
MNITRLPTLFAAEPFLFDDAYRNFMQRFRWEPVTPGAPQIAPQIPMEIVEMDDVYSVTAGIPGVKKEDIHVEIDGRQVMITAEYKKPVYEKKDVRFLREELSYGFASRVFTLGFEVDRTKAVAKYADGVLTLMLPKLVSAHVETLVVQ